VPIVLLLLYVLASEAGFLIHKRIGRGGDGGSADESQVLSTALLLLALLLGFTFSIALSRFDERRQLVVQESNDIGTAWLRAGLYETPPAAALQQRLAAYAKTRIGSPTGEAKARLAAGARLRGEIWQLTAATTAPDRSTAQAASLVAAVNAVLDTATQREKAVAARVPGEVLLLLIVYSVVACFLLGYVLEAHGHRHRLASGTLFVLLALTMMLILDLDRPQGGYVSVDQQAMIDLVAGFPKEP
jgi:hypothetical protein